MRLLVSLVVNALALAAADYLVPGIRAGGWPSIAAVAILFGLVNALVRPFLTFVSCPVILLTLGLFTFVLNALLLMFTGWLAKVGGIDFVVDGFGPAFVGALIVSVVSTVLSWMLMPKKDERA
jgi:putative membrane protein